MYNHEPINYVCPFCLAVKGIENEKVQTKQADIFYKDDKVMAFIASSGWENNRGHVIIITQEHYENIYDLPDELNHKVSDLVKKVAVALKEVYKCPGITVRQHNEPEGGQDVWHYHSHVFPRYTNDRLYELINDRKFNPPEERKVYADKLKAYFENNNE